MLDQIYPIAYLNGEFLAWNQVQISPLDRGFLFGEGLYATIAVHHGQPLFCDQHLERLKQSCQELGFPSDGQDWQEVLYEIIRSNQLVSAGVSLIVTRGQDHARHHLPTATQPTVLAFAYPWIPKKNPLPVSAQCVPDPRPQDYAQLKINSLLPSVQASQKSHAQGFDKLIFTRERVILEAAQANLFWVKEGELFTPAADLPLVKGITRSYVIFLAQDLGLKVTEGKYQEQQLLEADEVFLCATLSQITPVSQIGEVSYSVTGSVTSKISQAYQQLCDAEAESLTKKCLAEKEPWL